jgi:hypothetical protein
MVCSAQILLVLIQKRPPKGHRLLVIGTTSNVEVLESLELAGPQVPPLSLSLSPLSFSLFSLPSLSSLLSLLLASLTSLSLLSLPSLFARRPGLYIYAYILRLSRI